MLLLVVVWRMIVAVVIVIIVTIKVTDCLIQKYYKSIRLLLLLYASYSYSFDTPFTKAPHTDDQLYVLLLLLRLFNIKFAIHFIVFTKNDLENL